MTASWRTALPAWLERLQRILQPDTATRCGRRQAAAVFTAAAALRDGLEGLEAVRQSNAAAFARVSPLVSEIADLSQDLVHEAEQLLQSASGTGPEGAVLQTTVAMLDEPFTYLDGCKPRYEEIIGQLEHCDRQIAGILGLREEWHLIDAPLKHIRTLCRIEAAVLPAELNAMFISVTQDIERLETEVGAMFEQRFTMLATIRTTLRGLASQLHTVLTEQHARTREKRTQISRTLEELQAELASNNQRDLRLSVTTRAISAAIGRIVVALQADDIIAQKLAHVCTATGQLLTGAEAVTPRTPRIEPAASHRRARVQIAHLDAIAADLDGTQATIAVGFDEIFGQIAQLDEGCLALQDLKKVTVAGDGMVQILLDALGAAEGLVQATVREARAGYERLNPLGPMTSTLTKTMMDLSTSMHLIALNAQLQAIQNGTGTGLEVLAARMTEISRGISDVSARAMTALNALAGSVHAAIGLLDTLRAEGEQLSAQLSAERQQRESQLHAIRDRSIRAMHAIGQHARKIETTAGGVARSFHVADEARESLALGRTGLCALQDATAELARTVDPAQVPASDDSGSTYTMATERAVHAAVFETSPAPAPAGVDQPVAPVPTGTGQESSIELF